MKLNLNVKESAFFFEQEEGLDEDGKKIVTRGREMVIVGFEPVALTKKDYESLLKGAKAWTVEAKVLL